MAKKKQAGPVDIPADIKACFEEYGFDPKQMRLEWAVATRTATDWFAILFKRPNGTLEAVDFMHRLDWNTNTWAWEVQNDGIDGFDSVNDFLNGPLTSTFF